MSNAFRCQYSLASAAGTSEGKAVMIAQSPLGSPRHSTHEQLYERCANASCASTRNDCDSRFSLRESASPDRSSRIPSIAIVFGMCRSASFERRDLVEIDRLLAGCSNGENNDLFLPNDEKGPEFPLRAKPEKKVSQLLSEQWVFVSQAAGEWEIAKAKERLLKAVIQPFREPGRSFGDFGKPLLKVGSGTSGEPDAKAHGLAGL
jgi:hypothetical protein